MKYFPAALIVTLLFPMSGFSQISIEASKKERTEVSSPMVATIPLEIALSSDPMAQAARLFKTDELSTTICDAVSLKTVEGTLLFNKKKTKGELTVIVSTYTEPPQDKMAFVSFRILNDEEILRLPTSINKMSTTLTLKINAEEKKTRLKSKTAKIDPEQLTRILAGENPRVEITLKVEIN